jgi:hypothetical protein
MASFETMIMPVDIHRVTRADIIPDSAYAAQRAARRAALLPIRKLRRIALGPYCTLYFESYETMLFQIQEMLLTEKGGAEQLEDELAAYNPLIPQGDELVATVMFEIDEPARRAEVLGQLGGVEAYFFLSVGEHHVFAKPAGDIDRARDGKTSSVHFLRFPMTEAQAEDFRDASKPVMVGCNHPRYGHLAVLSDENRAELDKDLD